MSIAYLKLYSGMHQDALVPIDYPRIMIGGREDVDIVLGDQALKDNAFVVDVYVVVVFDIHDRIV